MEQAATAYQQTWQWTRSMLLEKLQWVEAQRFYFESERDMILSKISALQTNKRDRWATQVKALNFWEHLSAVTIQVASLRTSVTCLKDELEATRSINTQIWASIPEDHISIL